MQEPLDEYVNNPFLRIINKYAPQSYYVIIGILIILTIIVIIELIVAKVKSRRAYEQQRRERSNPFNVHAEYLC